MIRKAFAGFDGGGSKTLCALCDEDGRLLGIGAGGASNYRYCGEETARKSMRDALANAFLSAGLPVQKLHTAYVSSAVIPTYGGENYVPFFASCVDCEHLLCEGDLYPVWYGACKGKPAIVLIAGTGSVAYLFRDKTVVRAGGWGPQIGDEGSGYFIGISALRRVMRMYDGREAADEAFLKGILNHYQIDEPRGLIALAKQDRATIASCAALVCALAEAGDPTARDILQAACDELCALVGAVLSRDAEEDFLPLVLSGGLVGQNTILKRLLCAKVLEQYPRILSAQSAKASPALVCAALALRDAGLKDASDRLIEFAKEDAAC